MSALASIALALRVLSADFCADQFALALADRSDIAALSPDAARDFSHLRAEAEGLPRARADAEEALSRGADLVLRFWGGDAARYERLGVRTVTLDYAADFDAVKANIRAAAAALGHETRGEALIADMEARLAALSARGPSGVRTLYVTPGGVTAGKGTMIDAILSAAGVINVAATQSGWPPLPLEKLVIEPPQLVVAGFFRSDAESANHWTVARHPVLKEVFGKTPTLHLPADIPGCPAWFSVAAAEMIRDAADGARHAR